MLPRMRKGSLCPSAPSFWCRRMTGLPTTYSGATARLSRNWGGGFHHLVIFGQHGVSTTQVTFLGELSREQDSVPLLAIAAMSKVAGAVHSIELPKGDRDGELDDSQTWGAALERIRVAVSGESSPLLHDLDGVKTGSFRKGTLADTVAGVFSELGAEV